MVFFSATYDFQAQVIGLCFLFFVRNVVNMPLTPEVRPSFLLRQISQTRVKFPAGVAAHLWLTNIHHTWRIGRPSPLSWRNPPYKDEWEELETRVFIASSVLGLDTTTQLVAWVCLFAMDRHLRAMTEQENVWYIPYYDIIDGSPRQRVGQLEVHRQVSNANQTSPDMALQDPIVSQRLRSRSRWGYADQPNATITTDHTMFVQQTFTSEEISTKSMILLIHKFLCDNVWKRTASQPISRDVAAGTILFAGPLASGVSLLVEINLVQSASGVTITWDHVAEVFRQLLYKPVWLNRWKAFEASAAFAGENDPFVVMTMR